MLKIDLKTYIKQFLPDNKPLFSLKDRDDQQINYYIHDLIPMDTNRHDTNAIFSV